MHACWCCCCGRDFGCIHMGAPKKAAFSTMIRAALGWCQLCSRGAASGCLCIGRSQHIGCRRLCLAAACCAGADGAAAAGVGSGGAYEPAMVCETEQRETKQHECKGPEAALYLQQWCTVQTASVAFVLRLLLLPLIHAGVSSSRKIQPKTRPKNQPRTQPRASCGPLQWRMHWLEVRCFAHSQHRQFVLVTGGAHPPPAGHTQLSRVQPDCRGHMQCGYTAGVLSQRVGQFHSTPAETVAGGGLNGVSASAAASVC